MGARGELREREGERKVGIAPNIETNCAMNSASEVACTRCGPFSKRESMLAMTAVGSASSSHST